MQEQDQKMLFFLLTSISFLQNIFIIKKNYILN